MTAEITTMGFCPQYFSRWTVEGSSGATYLVTFSGLQAHCTCPAFKFSQNNDCKHIKRVWEHGCMYNPQWKDPGPDDWFTESPDLLLLDVDESQPKLDERCAGCNQPTVPVKVAV